MEKLRAVIEQYGRWSELVIYTERIDAHINTDFSHSLENAKALLETISKEICKTKGVELKANSSINSVLKKAFTAIGYTNSNLVMQVSSALASIGQQMGGLRNEIGATSHGKSLDELRERNDKVDELTREFLIDSTEIIASFLIRTFENENPRISTESLEKALVYSENQDFNDFLDGIYEEFKMGDSTYAASEILFHLDYQAYATEYQTYVEAME